MDSSLFAVRMRPSFQGLPILLYVTSGFSASLPPSLAILTPSSTTLSNSTDAISINGTVRTPPPIQPFCTRTGAPSFGMSEASCTNAWQKIDRSTTTHVFRPRRPLHEDGFVTPIRYLSDDGICAIDVQLDSGREDSSSTFEISWYAKMILDACVTKLGKGGSIRGFSKWVIPNGKPPTVQLQTSLSFLIILVLLLPLNCSLSYDILRLNY